MTKTGTYKLLAILKATYPRFYANMRADETEVIVSVWNEMLLDIDDSIATVALKRLIATSKFPPTIAELLESVRAVKYSPLPDAGQAWEEINKAISNFGYYRGEEAMASFSCDTTRQVVRRMGWRELCSAPLEHEMANRAHFLKMWDAMTERIKENQIIPDSIKLSIAQIGQHVPSLTDSASHIAS